MQNLGLLPGGTSSIATAVSADGLAVVGFDYTVGTARYRAFRWTGAGGMQDLGSLPGEGQTGYIFANGTNGDGSAVVGRIDEGNISAFLWTSSLGMVDLNAYLPTLGVNLTGWELVWANGISADGSSIVGRGTYNGVDRGWLVTGMVPEPGTMLAFCAGLAACAWRRRRRRHLNPGKREAPEAFKRLGG
jgi:probable HAF family extracellular repeat protein